MRDRRRRSGPRLRARPSSTLRREPRRDRSGGRRRSTSTPADGPSMPPAHRPRPRELGGRRLGPGHGHRRARRHRRGRRGRRRRPGAARVLPRYRARLGRRLRPRRPSGHRRASSPSSTPGSGSTGWSCSTSTTRAPSAARGSIAMSISALAGSASAGSRHLLRHPALAHVDLPSSRRRAWTRATTRSTSHAPATSPPAGRLRRLPPEAFEVREQLERGRPPARPCRRRHVAAIASRRSGAAPRRPRLIARSLGPPRAARLLAARAPARRSRDARHVGRRPGPRHAGPARVRPRRVVPLLGPPTSIGDVHHGALYYYLLVARPRC